MTDEDDASSSSKIIKNDNELTNFEECKDIINIFNGEQQDDIERKSARDCEVKDEFDDDDELIEDKLNDEELDQDSMLLLNGKCLELIQISLSKNNNYPDIC